jgi:hypothetical protein
MGGQIDDQEDSSSRYGEDLQRFDREDGKPEKHRLKRKGEDWRPETSTADRSPRRRDITSSQRLPDLCADSRSRRSLVTAMATCS